MPVLLVLNQHINFVSHTSCFTLYNKTARQYDSVPLLLGAVTVLIMYPLFQYCKRILDSGQSPWRYTYFLNLPP